MPVSPWGPNNGVSGTAGSPCLQARRREAAVSPLLRPESGTKTRPGPNRSRAPNYYAHSSRSEAGSRFFTPKNGGEKGDYGSKWPPLLFIHHSLWKMSPLQVPNTKADSERVTAKFGDTVHYPPCVAASALHHCTLTTRAVACCPSAALIRNRYAPAGSVCPSSSSPSFACSLCVSMHRPSASNTSNTTGSASGH